MKHITPTVLIATVLLFGVGCGSDNAEQIDLPEKVAPASQSKRAESNDESGTVVPEQRELVRLSGTLEAADSGSVAANVNGLIREVYVDEGDRVEKGDKLVNIDAADYRLRVRQAEAALASAKAQRDTLQVEYKRTKELLARKAVARSAYDQLSGQLSAAEAGVNQAEVALDMAQKARRDALVRAPFDGVVTKVHATPGAFAAAGPSPLIDLEGATTLELRIAVPESYAGRVKTGTELQMKLPATGHTQTVTVARVNPVVNRATRSYDVIAEIPEPSENTLPGMFAEVSIDLGGKQ